MSRETTPSAERKQSVARNPKATYDYHVLETWETGIVLTGTEVKSLRNGKASIKEAYARVRNGEVFLEGMNITPYEQGNRYNHDPVRSRKLLLHRKEIQKLIGAVEQRGLTLVPLELYFKNGRAKIALALGKGKKQHDKRETIKRKIQEREGGPGRLHPRPPVISFLALLAALAGLGLDSAPAVLTVANAKGESRIPVRTDETGAPVVSAPVLMGALDGTAAAEGWLGRGHRGAPGLQVPGGRAALLIRRPAPAVGLGGFDQ